MTAPLDTAGRLKRLLAILAWLAQVGEAPIDQVASRFDLTPEALVTELEMAACCGVPPYTPDQLMEILVTDSSVSTRMGTALARPRRLSPPEGFALAASARALLAVPGSDGDGALSRALGKLDRALGGEQIAVELDAPPWLGVVGDAAASGGRLAISYYSASSDRVTDREIAPIRLFASEGHWYVDAWCSLAGDLRRFRVDRINAAEPVEATADDDRRIAAGEDGAGGSPGPPTPGGDPGGFDPFVPGPDSRRVRLSLDPSTAWLVESIPSTGPPESVDGRVELEVFVGGDAWLERLLLRLGPDALVVRPEEYRGLRAEAAAPYPRALSLGGRFRLGIAGAPAGCGQGVRQAGRQSGLASLGGGPNEPPERETRPRPARPTGPVLKANVVRGDGYRYYVDDLTPGRAEGSLVAGESPGIWSGQGAVALGLAGRVESPALAELLEGRDPLSGRRLRQPRRHRSVAGYDLTFCAPKSVSLLHLLAPGEMAGEVGEGHRTAVEEAVGYLGRSAVGVRRSRNGGVTLLSSTGAVAGQFVHRTSRALDPHLHTHLVVANVAEGVDGAWSAVDSRRLFAHVPAAQGIYHARLRLELTHRLGAAWEVPPTGLGDVVGVDRRLRRLFSTRTAAIDEYDHGRTRPARSPTRARSTRGAFHATRPAKDLSRTVDSLITEWKERAADFGFDLGDLSRVVGLGRLPGRPDPVHPFEPGRLRARLESWADRDRAVSPRDLVAVVATSTNQGGRRGRDRVGGGSDRGRL